jgi:hypothetical protein
MPQFKIRAAAQVDIPLILTYLDLLARERGCGRFERWILDWNEPAISFYCSIGAIAKDEWTVQRVDGESLDMLANRVASESEWPKC